MYYLIPNIRYILCIKYYIIYAFLTSPPAAALCSLWGLLWGLLGPLRGPLLGQSWGPLLELLGPLLGPLLGVALGPLLEPIDTHRARHRPDH